MATLYFDTLEYAKYLIAGGVPPAQANAHAEAAKNFLLPSMASEDDVASLADTMARDLAKATDAVARDLVAVEQRLINRILLLVPATIGACAALIVALVAAFPFLSKTIGK